jgi:hypothetical protein
LTSSRLPIDTNSDMSGRRAQNASNESRLHKLLVGRDITSERTIGDGLKAADNLAVVIDTAGIGLHRVGVVKCIKFLSGLFPQCAMTEIERVKPFISDSSRRNDTPMPSCSAPQLTPTVAKRADRSAFPLFACILTLS